METGSEPPREVSRLLQPKWSPKGNDHVGPCLQGQKLSSTMFWNSFRRCLCWSTRMWDLCGTCKNINNFVACAVSRSFCRLVANHAEFRGCLLCAPKSGKEFEIWEFVWPCRDLPETGDGPRTYWFDSVRMSSHIMQPYLNLHTTTIVDHWHVEHLLASQMLTHKELGFEFIWRGITCTQVKFHIVNSQSSQYKSNSYESAKMQQWVISDSSEGRLW